MTWRVITKTIGYQKHDSVCKVNLILFDYFITLSWNSSLFVSTGHFVLRRTRVRFIQSQQSTRACQLAKETSLPSTKPRSGILRTQILKTNLLRTQSSMSLPLQPGVCQNIATHALSSASDFFLELISTFPVHSPSFFSKPLSSFAFVSCG